MSDDRAPGERFRRRKYAHSYRVRDVDAFLARVEAGEVTSDQVERVQFRSVFLTSGYDEKEVDDALDEVARELRAKEPPRPPRQPWWTPLARSGRTWSVLVVRSGRAAWSQTVRSGRAGWSRFFRSGRA